MDVFGGSTGEIRPLKAPGICFLCEATPVQETDLVVNTMRYFSPGPLTNLNGTKYVCGSCADDLGRAVGLVDAIDFADVVESNGHLKDTVSRLNEQVQAYASLQAAVETLQVAPAEVTQVASDVVATA